MCIRLIKGFIDSIKFHIWESLNFSAQKENQMRQVFDTMISLRLWHFRAPGFLA